MLSAIIARHGGAVADALPGEGKVLLVTGGRGVVGRRVVREALAQGYQVVCTSRSDLPTPDQYGVEWIQADFEDRLQGLSAPFWAALIEQFGITHIAECAGVLTGTRQQMENVNFRAPAALSSAAAHHSVTNGGTVERYVQISSLDNPGVQDNAIWNQYRALRAHLNSPEIKGSLNWVDVAPTHIYATLPREAHLPYHMQAAVPYNLNLDPDALMQPIHVAELTHGIVNLMNNGKGTHETLAAVGPEIFPHNDFIPRVREALGIRHERTRDVILRPQTFKTMGRTNALLNLNAPGLVANTPLRHFGPISGATVGFNTVDSYDESGRFAEAAELPHQQTLERHFQRDATALLHNLEARGAELREMSRLFEAMRVGTQIGGRLGFR